MTRILETERLLLRPPERRDISALVPLIGDYDVAKNLSTVPHPYAESDAIEWISHLDERRERGDAFQFGVTRKNDGAYMGGCGLHLKDGEYATEAARGVLEFAFAELRVPEVWAGWFHDNPRSGNVLSKLGFVSKGFEARSCMARGMDVGCNIVTLRGDAFERRLAS
jgi:RimJ/RimL family protein N-acetyltransferase